MAARENIFRRIRLANERALEPGIQEEQIAARRLRDHARGPMPQMNWEPAARFRERCVAMASTIDEVPALSQVPQAVANYLKQYKLPARGVCWPELGDLAWQAAGLEIEARACTGDDMVGITGSFCAIAETGTLMLLSGEHWHATTSLLPDTHVAIVRASRIVRAMEDGWDLLRREHGEVPRQVNFVSGPSRTADIEMTLVLGAHGPFRVHVIVVRD